MLRIIIIYTFIDLFAGIGGFHLGLKQAGFTCRMASEIDESAKNIYEKNHKIDVLGDITKIDPKSVPDHDVLTAGFPCQPFSICGQKKGFDDTRGTMFFHICSIIKEKSPRVVFLENVKFLLHHDGGNTLKVIIKNLQELGYFVSYSIQNAVHYGVPQNRERIIIIASKNKKFNFNKIPMCFERTAIKDFLDIYDSEKEYLHKNEYELIKNPIIQKQSGLCFTGYRKKTIRKKGVREGTLHLSRVHKQPNRIYSVLGSHPTLPSQETSGRFFIYLPDENKVRKLTIRECYRIMGFPDDFVISPIKTEAYRQIGNSVCVPMVSAIAQQIKQQLLGDNNEIRYILNKPVFEQSELFG